MIISIIKVDSIEVILRKSNNTFWKMYCYERNNRMRRGEEGYYA